MREILNELSSDEEYFAPSWSAAERPAEALEVTRAEMSCAPYESEADRDARLAKERAKKEKETAARGEDIGARALQQMMFNTLAVKSDKDKLTRELEAPAWMTELVPDDFTEEQRKEVRPSPRPGCVFPPRAGRAEWSLSPRAVSPVFPAPALIG